MSSSPGGAASPSRGSHLWNSLGNAPVVGLMAVLAFVLSLGQAGVQYGNGGKANMRSMRWTSRVPMM